MGPILESYNFGNPHLSALNREHKRIFPRGGRVEGVFCFFYFFFWGGGGVRKRRGVIVLFNSLCGQDY